MEYEQIQLDEHVSIAEYRLTLINGPKENLDLIVRINKTLIALLETYILWVDYLMHLHFSVELFVHSIMNMSLL